jgi:TPR repeat protein
MIAGCFQSSPNVALAEGVVSETNYKEFQGKHLIGTPNGAEEEPSAEELHLQRQGKYAEYQQAHHLRMTGVLESSEIKKKQALAIFRKLSVEGFSLASWDYAEMVAGGVGTKADDVEALQWYKIAAQQGSPYAHWTLAQKYEEGRIVPQDYRKALEHYEEAASIAGGKFAMYAGFHYTFGKLVEANSLKAIYWYTRAGRDRYVSGFEQISEIYSEGQGVTKDLVLARMWCILALEKRKSSGDESTEGGCVLTPVPANMSRHDTLIARQLAEKCRESDYSNCRRPSSPWQSLMNSFFN